MSFNLAESKINLPIQFSKSVGFSSLKSRPHKQPMLENENYDVNPINFFINIYSNSNTNNEFLEYLKNIKNNFELNYLPPDDSSEGLISLRVLELKKSYKLLEDEKWEAWKNRETIIGGEKRKIKQ